MNLLENSHYYFEVIIPKSQLIIDFGLVVLIWMVQLIVYPSFLHFTPKNLMIWHQKYTNRISIIVIPLMLLQLAIAIYKVFFNLNIFSIISLSIVVFLWGFTLTSFAPIHFKIAQEKHSHNLLHRLVVRNWWRTFLWSALFLFDFLIQIIKSNPL